ncbi:MAG: aldo/keto reductase, partial [Phycisphaerales bacterium]|nr:aldo/keto reductase [Phycisphaerales bacterium]
MLTMQTRRFGRTEHQVSTVGFGGAEIGFLAEERERVGTLLNELLDHGMNVIDTAAMYRGSEEHIGETIGHRRNEYVLISKCGHPVEGINAEPWSASMIDQTIDRALRRLKTDRLDVMLLHSCDLETLKKGEALGALVKAREDGRIVHAGYSGDNEAAAWAAAQEDVAVIETSVSICDQVNIDKVLPVCVTHDVGVLVKRPIANAAWRSLDEIPEHYHNYASVYIERLKKMKLDPKDCGFTDDDWAELALRFTLSQPGAHCAIIGTTSPKNVQANLEAAQKGPLTPVQVATIRAAFSTAEKASGESWTGQ